MATTPSTRRLSSPFVLAGGGLVFASAQTVLVRAAEGLGVACGLAFLGTCCTRRRCGPVAYRGHTGMPALKRILQEQVREHLTPAGRLGRRVDVVGSAPDDLLSNVFTESILLLQEARRSIRSDQFSAAVTALSGAREVVVMGTGALGMLGRCLSLRLIRLGYRCRDALTSGFLLADDLIRLTERDVVVLVVHEKVTVEIEVVLDHAREVGATVVLVTDTLGEALRDRVAIVLTTPAGSSQMYKMQTTTLALFEVLTLAIAAQQQEPTLHAMALMNRLRDELRYTPDR
ncbi:MurR/RpiR family transcriptional regulator [Amycolatopsis sp. NPDC001319]|uniref:MurR/RpiR family transcriptional regulator n=1 Tax=unclassified Amycolatopsis TaxID=2618356 RepID=UPI0036ADAAD1